MTLGYPFFQSHYRSTVHLRTLSFARSFAEVTGYKWPLARSDFSLIFASLTADSGPSKMQPPHQRFNIHERHIVSTLQSPTMRPYSPCCDRRASVAWSQWSPLIGPGTTEPWIIYQVVALQVGKVTFSVVATYSSFCLFGLFAAMPASIPLDNSLGALFIGTVLSSMYVSLSV